MVQRIVPSFLQPAVLNGLLSRGFGSKELQDTFRTLWSSLQPRREGPLDRAAPWLALAGEAGLLEGAATLHSARGRALVVACDRAAALVAGDAESAASAVLRSSAAWAAAARGAVDIGAEALAEAQDAGGQRVWASRREALLQRFREPRPEVRVRELLRWAETDDGRELIALATCAYVIYIYIYICI